MRESLSLMDNMAIIRQFLPNRQPRSGFVARMKRQFAKEDGLAIGSQQRRIGLSEVQRWRGPHYLSK